jgi:hypothetical protein
MLDLVKAIPDVEVMLALEPEELGAKILFLAKARFGSGMFHPDNLQSELWTGALSGQESYPRQQQRLIGLALTEAWSWLEAQGLVVPEDDMNGRNGWRRLSRRAQRFENAAEFANYAVARMLPKEALHSRISGPVWMSFMRGEFDTAAFHARYHGRGHRRRWPLRCGGCRELALALVRGGTLGASPIRRRTALYRSQR